MFFSIDYSFSKVTQQPEVAPLDGASFHLILHHCCYLQNIFSYKKFSYLKIWEEVYYIIFILIFENPLRQHLATCLKEWKHEFMKYVWNMWNMEEKHIVKYVKSQQ